MNKQLGFLLLQLGCVAALLNAPNTANAESLEDAVIGPLVGTRMMAAAEQRSQGKLTSCYWEYKIVLRDHAYKMGGYVLLSGSLTVFYFKGKAPNVALKMQGFDIAIGADAKPKMTPFEIAYGYPTVSGKVLARREGAAFRCENGGFCASYVNDFPDIISAVLTDQVRLSYSRTASGFDVSTDLRANDLPEGASEIDKGASCLRQVLKRYELQD